MSIDSYIFNAKSTKDKKISNNKKNYNDKNDIIFEVNNNKLSTFKISKIHNERLHYCTKYYKISSKLLKRVMKDKEVTFNFKQWKDLYKCLYYTK